MSNDQSGAPHEQKEGIVVNPVHHRAPEAAPEDQAPEAKPASGTATGSMVTPQSKPNEPVIKQTAAQPAAPAPAHAKPAPMITSKLNSDEVNRQLTTLLKDASLPTKIAINTIHEYLEAMAPGKPISKDAGTRQQVVFYQAVTTIINKVEGQEFRNALSAVLLLLHHHRDAAFRETHVFRFVEWIPLTREHRRGFEKIITLLKTLADPKSRQQVLKQLNFEPLLKYGVTERGRVKLTAFFEK